MQLLGLTVASLPRAHPFASGVRVWPEDEIELAAADRLFRVKSVIFQFGPQHSATVPATDLWKLALHPSRKYCLLKWY